MFGLTAKTRIAIGQCFLLLSVLLVALAIGVMPDPRVATMAGRVKLCEAIAAQSSATISQGDVRRLASVMRFIADRNPEIVSAAVRRHDGRLVVQVGDHANLWDESPDRPNTDSQIQVPIRAGSRKWGAVEVQFRPLTEPGVIGYLRSPRTRLVGFVTAASLLLFMVYLGKMLQHLDPSKVVPRRVRDTLNVLAEGLMVVDRQGRIMLANDVFAGIVGISPEQLVGRRADKLPWINCEDTTAAETTGDDFPWVRALAAESMLSGIPIQLRDAQGEVRTFMANCMPVLRSDGKFGGVFATFEDVTELERNKVEISEAKEAAEAANVAKSEFLARMSHEIRTPMNAILGFTEVLRRGFDGSQSERQDYLETIHASGQHLLDLINDILDLSKVEAGKVAVEQVRCSPVQVVSEVVTMLRVRAEQKGITLEADLEGDLPETILSDPTRLRQMLMNLVGNAIKFTDVGGVKLAVRLQSSPHAPRAVTRHAERDGYDGPRLAIDVIDTGIGIAPESISRIFDPFTQADTSITRRFGGTGLGLAICRRFADLLGGELSVASVPGAGSTFSLTLPTGPLEGVRMLDAKSAKLSIKEGVKCDRSEFKLPPARILVVDDGAENRKLVELVLRRAGVHVESATNGAEAVERVTRSGAPAFDIILMDVQMPVMDGYTAVRTLRQQHVTIPIFALTAHAMKGTEEQCRAAGYSGYLPKPVDIDRLINTLAEVLDCGSACAQPSSLNQQPLAEQESPSMTSPPSAPPHATVNPQSAIRNLRSLVSTLPCDDSEFREIVEEFIVRLRDRMTAIEAAWADGDLSELQRLAHWLKGSGGTAGFDAFTQPARDLETAIKEGRTDAIASGVAELRGLVDRVAVAPGQLAACG